MQTVFRYVSGIYPIFDRTSAVCAYHDADRNVHGFVQLSCEQERSGGDVISCNGFRRRYYPSGSGLKGIERDGRGLIGNYKKSEIGVIAVSVYIVSAAPAEVFDIIAHIRLSGGEIYVSAADVFKYEALCIAGYGKLCSLAKHAVCGQNRFPASVCYRSEDGASVVGYINPSSLERFVGGAPDVNIGFTLYNAVVAVKRRYCKQALGAL